MQGHSTIGSPGTLKCEATADSRLSTAAKRRVLSILLVDDDKAWCTALRMGLELAGHHVTPCNAAVDALAAYRRAPEEFDLVITDFWMPERNGLELAFDLRAVRPVPMLLMSGYCAGWTPAWIKSIGVQELLRKPLTIVQIMAAIDRVFAQDRIE